MIFKLNKNQHLTTQEMIHQTNRRQLLIQS